MAKLIAIVNVIAWSGFWAFGYLALTAEPHHGTQMVIAAILAAMGAGMGLIAWLWLTRHAERIGYARPSNRVATEDRPNVEGPTA